MKYLARQGRATRIVHAGLVEHVTPFSHVARYPAIAPFWNPGPVQGLAALDSEMTYQASTIAYVNDFKLMMIMTYGRACCCRCSNVTPAY